MPGFWMYETGGELQPAILAYLQAQPLTTEQIALIRDYLEQWIFAPGFVPTPGIIALRQSVVDLQKSSDITRWLSAAIDEGVDPL